jgi:hypothetical protein
MRLANALVLGLDNKRLTRDVVGPFGLRSNSPLRLLHQGDDVT